MSQRNECFQEIHTHTHTHIKLSEDNLVLYLAETRTPVEVSGLSRGGPRLLRREFRIWLQAELSRRRRTPISGTSDNPPSLGTPTISEGQVRQLRQVLPIEAQLQLEGDRGSEL